MKYSIFNNIIDISEKTAVIYNALSDKTLFLSKQKLSVLDLSDMDDNLYKTMKKNHFIVDDDCNETKEYINEVLEAEKNSPLIHLLINPTIDCNFRCWYCYESHKKSQMSEETISKVKKLILSIFQEGKDLQISWFGGEPMMYYKQVIIPILQYVKVIAKQYNRVFYTNMTTNGFLFTTEKIKELVEYNFNGVQITLDGNKEKHDQIRFSRNGVGSYDRIIKNIKNLAENGIAITLRINCTESNIDSMADIASSFNTFADEYKKHINVDLHIVWQESRAQNIKEKMGDIVKAFVNDGFTASKMSFRDFCYGDKRSSCVINYNGNIFKCTAVDFDNIQRDGYLNEEGRIIWENNSLEKRMASRFKNTPCLSCRIYPLCHGGCTKQSLNNTSEYCIHGFNENEKDKVVLDRIEYNITHHAESHEI